MTPEIPFTYLHRMDYERIQGLVDSTGAKVAATYYVIAAVGLYRLFGRLSSPNPKLQQVALRDLDSNIASHVGADSPQRPQQKQPSSSSSPGAPMKRKLVRGSVRRGLVEYYTILYGGGAVASID